MRRAISSKPLVRSICLAACLTIFPSVCTGDWHAQNPTETVAATVDSVVAVLQEADLDDELKKKKIKATVSKHFDFNAMAKRVLATNWEKANVAQRETFTSLFKELLTNTYWQKISGYQNETVEYFGEKQRGKLATVNTLIKTSTVDIPVDYKLYRKEDANWYAYDVVIEQVSLVRNYRGSFQKIVHDVGINGLLEQLAAKVAQSATPGSRSP